MKPLLLPTGLLALASLALPFRPAPPAEPAAPSADPVVYAIDGVHSSVVFKVRHMGVSNFYGAFKTVSGDVAYDAAKPDDCEIRIEIDAASVDSRDPKRDDHLRSPDFLNASEFPTITFGSKRVTERDGKLVVEGELELRGVKRPVTAIAEKIGEAEARGRKLIGFEATFTIDAEAFDLAYVGKIPATALGRKIDVIVSLECSAR